MPCTYSFLTLSRDETLVSRDENLVSREGGNLLLSGTVSSVQMKYSVTDQCRVHVKIPYCANSHCFQSSDRVQFNLDYSDSN